MAIEQREEELEEASGAGRRPAPGRITARLTWLAGRRSPRRLAAGYAVALLGTVALTVALLPVRDQITPLAKGFGFLVVVIAAAATGGLGPGLVASVVAFLAFNFFFLPPYDTFVIARGEYVVVLFVFLGLSVLISALLARATERAEAAEAREEELRILRTLSADLVAMVPGPESYEAVLSDLLGAFGFTAGALFVLDPLSRELEERARVGASAEDLSPRWDPASGGPSPERLPLSVGGRTLGLFVLRRGDTGLLPSESRVLRAFCDQFALVLERDRLLRAATEADVYRQSDQVRRAVLAAVSHDLRTPLAAIKASVTDLLDANHATRSEHATDALETIDRETDRLASLVANLLDMSRIEGGMLQARVQTIDVEEILDTCVERVHRQWPELALRVRTEQDAALVRADPVFLDRVVTNLLDNAAKAARANRSDAVDLDARRSDGRTVVRVIDHGPGVPPPVREQLFYPFYQLGARHPRLGTGLGLAIAKGFLALMEGEIWIEDTTGGGATFAFSLPCARAAP